ncbi:MAG: BBE domain-containing protein, partial [Egibacteraceae bacterium]
GGCAITGGCARAGTSHRERREASGWAAAVGNSNVIYAQPLTKQWEALRPYGTGVYANFLSDEDTTEVAKAYGARLPRLTALKDRYDPTNFFRLNANIPPSGGAR